MDKKTSPTSRKSSQKPQRFQVDPLSVLSTPNFNSTTNSTPRHYSTDEAPETPPDQNIELLSLDTIEPDPWNPRHILPHKLRQNFISRKTDAKSTVEAWIQAGKSDKETGEQIQQFRIMGESLQQQGQINPINVAKHFREDGSFVWRIESGERRFWAKWLLVFDGIAKEKNIHAVLRDNLDPARQAVENLQTESLSAIGESRQIARLFLAELGITPENTLAQDIPPGSDDYFRIALRPTQELLLGRKRLPRGYWPKLEKIVGNKRQHLERKLQLLRLPNDLLSLSDLYRLTERQLREIISRPEDRWRSLITYTIKHNITGTELAHISNIEDPKHGLQIILNKRSDKPTASTKKKNAQSKSKENAYSLEVKMQKKVVSFAKYLSPKTVNKEANLRRVAEEIIQSGNHQVVLDSLTQLEALISYLKTKTENLDQKK